MNEKKVRNIAPPPSIPIKATVGNAEGVSKYDPKRLENHVLFRFQPTHIMRVPKDDYSASQVTQLEEWWSNLNIGDRDSPFVASAQGIEHILWTFCGGDDADFDNGVFGDDCE